MRLCQVLIVTVTCFLMTVWACEVNELHNGCKIFAGSCTCGFGCNTEYIYKTKSACRSALHAFIVASSIPERTSNVCLLIPCLRGICIQTTNDIGYTCKCEGTGFYGQRCERACPTTPIRNIVFPHECIVI